MWLPLTKVTLQYTFLCCQFYGFHKDFSLWFSVFHRTEILNAFNLHVQFIIFMLYTLDVVSKIERSCQVKSARHTWQTLHDLSHKWNIIELGSWKWKTVRITVIRDWVGSRGEGERKIQQMVQCQFFNKSSKLWYSLAQHAGWD
jgi:hypothetical protein